MNLLPTACAVIALGLAPARDEATAAPPAAPSSDLAPAPEATRAQEPTTCTYTTYDWSVARRRAVHRRSVSKPYDQVTPGERDPTDPRCTVCSEDQAPVTVADLPPVTVCWAWADRIRAALQRVVDEGAFDVETLTGYRVGRTRGPVRGGVRTALSNHAFGTALDVNAAHNGLYAGCRLAPDELTPERIAGCRRLHGGAWNPARRPRTTITEGGPLFRALSAIGWRWGGHLRGSTKDLMHFSRSGE